MSMAETSVKAINVNTPSVFKRYETKYQISAEKVSRLEERLFEHMELDAYGKTRICNIYFDTPDSRLVRTSLEKPIYKEKLRIRTYGVPKSDSNAFVELKKKYKGIVFKRRVVMPYEEAIEWICNGKTPENPTQIMQEIDWAIKYYGGLVPAAALFYDRCAYFGKDDNELRLTLDENITCRMSDFDLRHGDYGTIDIIEPKAKLMEVKIKDTMPLWMADMFDELQIFPSSFSKYGTAYCINETSGLGYENEDFDKGFNEDFFEKKERMILNA